MRKARTLAAVTLLLSLVGGGVAVAQEDTTTTVNETTVASGLSFSESAALDVAATYLDGYTTDGQVTMVLQLQGVTGEFDPEQLSITENGAPVSDFEVQEQAFNDVESFTALVIDTSGSMEEDGRLDAAKAAAIAYVEQKEPEDFVSIVTFDDETRVVSDFVNGNDTLIEAINALEPRGATAMFDGIVLAADLFGPDVPEARRSMIILTDGEDQGSTNSVDEAIAAVQGAGIRTFGVAIETGEFEPVDLESIAVAGGGLFLPTADPEELSAIYAQIQRELNRAIYLRFNSSITEPSQVEFAVSYGPLQTSVGQSVPGYSTTSPTTQPPATTTTLQLAAIEPTLVTYDLPLDIEYVLLLATLGIGGAVALFVYILIGNDGDSASRFGKRLAAYGRRGGLTEEKRSFLERIPLLNRFTAAAEEQVRKRGLLGAVNATLEQGNLPLSAGEAIAAALGLSAVAGLLAGVFTVNVIVGFVVFVLAVLLVFGVINFLGSREKRRFEDQLPDTLTLLSTSLRAGYSLLQAIEAVAQEAPNPTAREFGRAIAEARLGRQVTDALAGITTRTQSKDFEWAAMAIDIQREVGGNLAEVLQTVADTMMARNRLRGEIKALTAEGRISAIVLGALPFAIGGFLWSSNPEYLAPLFASNAGLIALGVGLLLMLGGMLWLRKIVNIEV